MIKMLFKRVLNFRRFKEENEEARGELIPAFRSYLVDS